MHKSVSSQKCPNKDINFWSRKVNGFKEYSKHVEQNYPSTGKIQKSESTLSEDALLLTTAVYWNSEKDYLDFRNDQIVDKYFHV